MYRLQHNIVEHPLTQTITFRIAEADFVVKINIFAPGLKFQADLGPPPAGLGTGLGRSSVYKLTGHSNLFSTGVKSASFICIPEPDPGADSLQTPYTGNMLCLSHIHSS